MFNNQPDLLDFTDETHHREPNFSTHLANEIRNYLLWLSFDVDIPKPNHESQRPDILFHRRNTHDHNTLVVEVKRYRNADVDKENWICSDDEEKIKKDWFKGKLKYDFGVSIIINDETKDFSFALITNEPRETYRYFSQNFDNSIPYTPEITELMEEIKQTKIKDIEADTREAELQVDKLFCQFYG